MSKPSRTFGERHHRYTIATARVDVAVPSDADSMSLEELELRGPHTSVTAAHNHFAALQIEPDKWAITPNLVGSHCVALTDADLGVLAGHGGSMVWSPLSNLRLYGAPPPTSKQPSRGRFPVALGSDWATSGSKNLLGEEGRPPCRRLHRMRYTVT